MWLPGNKRPDKLREAIKLFEDALKSQEVLNLNWKHSSLLQVRLIGSIEEVTKSDFCL